MYLNRAQFSILCHNRGETDDKGENQAQWFVTHASFLLTSFPRASLPLTSFKSLPSLAGFIHCLKPQLGRRIWCQEVMRRGQI